MKKKFPALLLALFVLLSVISAKGGAAGTRFIIQTPEGTRQRGDAFTVTIDLTGNPGFSLVQFALRYDQNQAKCEEISVGSLLENMMLVTNPDAEDGAIVVAVSLQEVSGDGRIASFAFQALEDMDSFSCSIENMLFTDFAGDSIPYTVTGAAPEAVPTPLPTIPGTAATPAPTAPEATLTPTPKATAVPTPFPTAPEASGGTDTPSAPRFTDTAGTWAEAYINQGAERGLFGGYTDGSFRPGNRLTRAEFIMVLWNLAGRPDPAGGAPFTDIAGRSANTRSAIAWAYGAGHVSGTTDTTFSPGDALTRQAAMKILFSYTGGVSGSERMFTAVYDGKFTDSGEISAWAKPAVYWGVYHEILNGTTPSTLNPRGTITRAQLAAIMVRYTDKFQKT